MLGGMALFPAVGATAIDAQAGRAGTAVAPPGGRGAVAGDYAVWLHANPPSSGWTNLSGGTIQIYGKVLGAADLTLTVAPGDDWGLSIYRDPNSAAIRSASGFAKSAGYVGVVAGLDGSTFEVSSPAGLQLRLSSDNPYFALYDLVGPTASYQDGTPFRPGDDTTWTIIELLRS